ncbi:MAG TPA: hypothetical protein DEA26_10135 [Oceanospirillales bacterium]|nr:hypothetical protein [Oceanospirillaceae bacterium]HBS43030.1 hypothetical protein [Oceanospirillales bacterium]|tara:strand:- start:1145 stop:1930 length:786 start_codon:yes stop_codon:yes gene_type:complete
MLSSVWAARWYLLLGTVTFLLTLLMTTPLHFVWQYVSPYTDMLPVRVAQPTGTLWQGTARISDPALGELDAGWTIARPYTLFLGELNLDLSLEGSALRFDGVTRLDGLWQGMPSHLELNGASGYLSSSVVNRFLAPQQVSMDGEFEISGLTADISLVDERLHSASGQLVYGGGSVTYPLQRGKNQTAELPVLVATIGTQGDNIVVPVVTEEGQPLGEAYLQPDGWGGVRVLRRAIDIAGQTWPDKQAAEDSIVFEVSQKVM